MTAKSGLSHHLSKYVGPLRAREILKSELSPTTLHELALTSIAHGISSEAKKSGTLIVPSGGTAMSALYPPRYSGLRKIVENLDFEFAGEEHHIHKLAQSASLPAPQELPYVYVPNAHHIRVPISASENEPQNHVSIYLYGKFTPHEFRKLTTRRPKPFTNHVIETLGLPPIHMAQFDPNIAAAGKGYAFGDPKRFFGNKLGDVHDLMFTADAMDPKRLARMIESGALRRQFREDDRMEAQRLRTHINSVLSVMEENHHLYAQWLARHAYNPHALVTESQWKEGIAKVRELFGAQQQETAPHIIIATKLQLVNQNQIDRLAKKVKTALGEENEETRSAMLANKILPILGKLFTPSELDRLAKKEPKEICGQLRERIPALKR